jgi:hypothetical protein
MLIRIAFVSGPIKIVYPTPQSPTHTLFIEVPVPSQESERSCIGVLELLILPLSTILYYE